MSVATLLTHTCTIVRPSSTTSALGTPKQTWSNLATGVACAVQQARKGSDPNLEGRSFGRRSLRVFFAATQDISYKDRITTISGPSGIASATLFEVMSPPVDVAGRNAYRAVDATEVDQ